MARVARSSMQIMKDVVFALVLREMLTRFGSRRMGAFWILFEPFAHIGALMFVFTVIRGRTVPGMEFPMFLLTGLIPFFLMRNLITMLMESVNANQALFAYPNIKIFDTYLARVIVEFCLSSCVYGMFIFILGFVIGYDVSIAYPLEWMWSLLVGISFAFGLGILLSIVVQVMPNIKTFIRLFFMPLYFISGVIFPLWIIPEKYLHWFLWNPFAHIVSNLRAAVFVNYPGITGVTQSYPLFITVVFLFCSLGLYRMRRKRLLMQ